MQDDDPTRAPAAAAAAAPPSKAPAPSADETEESAYRAEKLDWEGKARERKPVDFPLVYPVLFGADLVERLTVKPCSGREMKIFGINPGSHRYEHYLSAFGLMCNRPPEFVEAMAPVDVDRGVMLVTLFWRASRRTIARR